MDQETAADEGLVFLDVDQCQQEAGGEGDEADRHVEAQGAHEHGGDQRQREDLLAVRTAGAGCVEVGVLAAFAVAQLAQQGEQHDGQDGEDEVEGEAGGEERALGDGEAVLDRDVVHQHAGHGQRGEAAGVGTVDDEGAHQYRVDARLVGEADGGRCQQRHGGRGEGAQGRQGGGHQEEHPGKQQRFAPDEAHAGLDDDVDGAVSLGHAEEVGDADDRHDDVGREVREDLLVGHAEHEVADAEGCHQPHHADVQRPFGGDDEHHHEDDERDDLHSGHGRLRFRGGRRVEDATPQHEGDQTKDRDTGHRHQQDTAATGRTPGRSGPDFALVPGVRSHVLVMVVLLIEWLPRGRRRRRCRGPRGGG